MMILLPYFLVKFDRRTHTLQSAFQRLVNTRSNLKKIDRFAIQEGLVSDLWQSWNSFSRSVIIWSLKGSTTASGVPITSAYSANSIDEIRFVAMMAARNQRVTTLKSIAGDHAEPTWGDLAKINRIVSALSPTNEAQLLSAFGSSNMISDVQTVRNSCAHVSADRLADIRTMQVRYDDNDFMHPSDALFWIDPVCGDFSWSVWLQEMRLIAAAAIA